MDCKDAVQAMVATRSETLRWRSTRPSAANLSRAERCGDVRSQNHLVIIYSYGDFHAAHRRHAFGRSRTRSRLKFTAQGCLPANKVAAFFKNPFANLDAATNAPLKIDNALITPVPTERNGWLVAICLFVFMAFFAVGPGVCVWLALSELMPTRIRSNGMSIALLINQAVSTTIAAVFLPTVGKYGYSHDVLHLRRFHRDLFHHRRLFPARNQRQNLEEIEEHFEGAK